MERGQALPPATERIEASPPSLRSEPIVTLQEILGGRYFWLLLFYSASLLTITSAIAAQRHLWWDEIEVYYVAMLPSFDAIRQTLFSGVDWQPPTYYLPLYWLCKWFGASPLVLRSIAIFPYWLATLVLYVIVARRATPVHGFIAMLFPSLTLAFSYAFEARPYALVLLFTACAFLAWDLTHEEQTRRFALVALPLSLGAAFAVHYNASLVAIPLIAGEAIRAARRRAVDFPVVFAIVFSAWPVIFLLPHMLTLRHFSGTPSGLPLLGRLSVVYQSLFRNAILLFSGLCAALAYWFALRQKNSDKDRISAADFDPVVLAASAMFLVIPIVYCAISYFSRTYYPRYVLETVIGTAIFLALLFHGVHRAVPRMARVLAVVFAITAAYIAIHRLRVPDETDWGTYSTYSDLFSRSNQAVYGSTEPLILGQGPYLVALRYGDEDLRRRAFHLISDVPIDVDRVAGYDRMFYRGLANALPKPSHLADYESFTRQHRRFLLYNPDRWLLQRLLADGEEVKVKAALEYGPLYSVVLKQ